MYYIYIYLQVYINKDNVDKRVKVKDVNALSGGERSYTTLSLLLSLGEVVDNPFRAMDEFDIFM